MARYLQSTAVRVHKKSSWREKVTSLMKNSVKMMKRDQRTKQWKYHIENPVDTLKLLDAV